MDQLRGGGECYEAELWEYDVLTNKERGAGEKYQQKIKFEWNEYIQFWNNTS